MLCVSVNTYNFFFLLCFRFGIMISVNIQNWPQLLLLFTGALFVCFLLKAQISNSKRYKSAWKKKNWFSSGIYVCVWLTVTRPIQGHPELPIRIKECVSANPIVILSLFPLSASPDNQSCLRVMVGLDSKRVASLSLDHTERQTTIDSHLQPI